MTNGVRRKGQSVGTRDNKEGRKVHLKLGNRRGINVKRGTEIKGKWDKGKRD